MTLPVLGEILTLLLDGLSTFKEYVKQGYSLIQDLYTRVYEYVTFIFSTFPIDNDNRRILFSLIFYGMIIIVIFAFSKNTWTQAISDQPKEIEYSFNLKGKSQGTGGSTNGTPPITPTSTTIKQVIYNLSIDCVSDEDCIFYRNTADQLNLKCCIPERYEGYLCQGKCLSESIWDTQSEIDEACKHPNACLHKYTNITTIIDALPNTCSGYTGIIKDNYCMERYSESVYESTKDSICCDNIIYPCYGYCTVKGYNNIADCWDINKCYDQSLDHTVYLIEPKNEA